MPDIPSTQGGSTPAPAEPPETTGKSAARLRPAFTFWLRQGRLSVVPLTEPQYKLLTGK